MTGESHLVLTEKDGVTVIGFKDPTVLDAYQVGAVGRELCDLIERDGPKHLVLDFSTVKMLSSKTLSVLLKMRQQLERLEGEMVFSGIDPGLYRVFKITNLQNLFEFFEDTESAVAHFASTD